MKRLKYLLVYSLPISVYFSFNSTGWIVFFPVILFFGIVPLIELLIKPDPSNFSKEKAEEEKNASLYDWMLYLAFPIQVGLLVYFLFIIASTPFGTMEYFGKTLSMGFMCGVVGINVGHELGHRRNRIEQFIGELLLLSSLDTHFLPYHNGGHHKDVATPEDAATAGKNQFLFTFWISSHFRSYVKAWQLENDIMRRQSKNILSLNNRMVVYSIANILLLSVIYYFFNIKVLGAFVMASMVGISLLETVNYIEHYGLARKKKASGGYEKVRHNHSWNSDHQIGRLLLFNLSRHSDHHYNGSKKYAVLESLPESPQMPTGYPGMMVLAVFQPLWFLVMNKRLKELQLS